ncbi:MAG TPA: aminotransferase class V-fold PLP-dependent enzyme [Pyrinomonadaceae bacterium]|nr:aminotransferase class V-fold PLP-dependent enzyme [Pyrinomonadaceae bacterium]
MKIETKAVHAGRRRDRATGAVTAPINLSTTFEREADGSYPTGFEYSRDGNPNRNALEECVSALEDGHEAAAFSSGSVATMTVFQALSPGDHVIASEDLYFGIRKLLRDTFVPWGLEVSFVDMTDVSQTKSSVRRNTRLVLAETPSNPLIKVTDIRKTAEVAHDAGAYFVCDNTMATSILQQPLNLGADLVVHATTKYLTGNDDVTGGIVVAKQANELFQKIRKLQKIGGAIPSPFDCWLTLRGINTLPYRMRAHSESALKIARFLNNHPAVERVLYPGLSNDAGHIIASQQMSLFGGVMSVQIKGGRENAMSVAAKVRIFTRATSFGGPHSLIEHRASVEDPATKTPDNLLRMAIGLEHVDDLIEDLTQALGD